MKIYIGNHVTGAALVSKEGNKAWLSIDGKPYNVDIMTTENDSCSVLHDGNLFSVGIISEEGHRSYDMNMFYRSYRVDIVDTQKKYLRMRKGTEEKQDNKIVAPTPGRVVEVPMWKGDRLKMGDTVVALGAMKMQSNYKVSSACVVKDMLASERDSVDNSQVPMTLDLLKDNSYE